jgi:hypothetical protein
MSELDLPLPIKLRAVLRSTQRPIAMNRSSVRVKAVAGKRESFCSEICMGIRPFTVARIYHCAFRRVYHKSSVALPRLYFAARVRFIDIKHQNGNNNHSIYGSST